ncbi:hypothetical protein LTR37_002143 [Vermiconidia calcicola]|uniref:Uncharacterized protein n=1 Tax=Vermiconidia calcicola TaxID=1690605 RepID=A0ACC3NVH0_9PEZI|nr:hypothetical protein LTR37_002143 [Vermiconidia calcicola]
MPRSKRPSEAMPTDTHHRIGHTPLHKFDPSEHLRPQIEERTANGETCEQIASALREQGIDITNKTISRRRVEWGLRQRATHKLAGTKLAKKRPSRTGSKHSLQVGRKEEIEAGTLRGEDAEQIAAAVIAQGFKLRKGASTILRLQTYWGLIPPDPDRAAGRKRKERVKKLKEPKISQREVEKEANRMQRTQTLHYPTNCSFGPKKRVGNGGSAEDGIEVDFADSDGSPQPMMMDDDNDDYSTPLPDLAPAPPWVKQHQTVSVAAEIMSVEILVDLANSTLGAANHLRDMLLAYQERVPAPYSQSTSPPTLEDLSTARRKVREAAAVMHDLAVEPID